ncbi:MAG: glycosyltransferase family 2 protein [Anaerolineae bacterium]|nr:glycosyltransferase family 2 protein [Anaerolineae bacterium]
MSEAPTSPDVSVVIPLYNEVENIPELYRQLTEALEGMGRPYEVIIADDGSTDGSFEALAEIHARDPRLKVIRFRRNYGQTAGFAAGFERARGEWIVTMDADLQNDPADIPKLIHKAEEGYDVVSGWRVHRQDALFTRKIPSRIANWLIARVTGVYLHDYGCSLKVYHRDVVKNIRLYGELHRFVPAVASGVGITVAEIPVNHRPRERGQSKYAGLGKTISRSVKVFLDLLTVRFLLSYSTRPIHIFGSMGLLLSGLGVLIGLYLTFEKLVLGQDIGTRPLLLLSVLLVILGVQMISMGLLGEVMVRTYFEAQDKPIYVVREELG